MKKISLIDHNEPKDVGVLGETPTSKIIGSLYFGAYKTEHAQMIEELINWASESGNEMVILQYIQKLWNDGKFSDLKVLADFVNETHLVVA